jgi:hypothetical protein
LGQLQAANLDQSEAELDNVNNQSEKSISKTTAEIWGKQLKIVGKRQICTKRQILAEK